MHIVGIRELKNRLTHYLSLTRKGVPVIVTDRTSRSPCFTGLTGSRRRRERKNDWHRLPT
jgi:antitoxin (DNA-binding transcriptional repressor) of toxin-antitoxin stability system